MSLAVIKRKISASADAAREAWDKDAGMRSDAIAPPDVLVGVYIPQTPAIVQKGGIPAPEFYTTITDSKGDSVFYFARDRQIYAVVSFKCEKKRTANDGKAYYEIIPSAEDVEMRRSPLRPIGCKVNEKDPISSATRLYVVDAIDPNVSKAVKRTS
jgi:hypothetical protein